jgi:Transketolase, thiamine diphosphate binding domain
MNDPMDQLCINTIRTLAMDAVQKANSGHPGTPMALAPVVYCLWQRFLRLIPAIRFGPTATASCCRSAMRRCCSTPCCT